MAFTNSMPAASIVTAHKVTTPNERKLKLIEQIRFLRRMKRHCINDLIASEGFERDLKILRKLYRDTLPDDVIRARCERLNDLRKKLNLRIVDNRISYTQKTTEAAHALCGGGV
ncbi:hypothetical protein [Alkalimonas mucilaginosa]|uniref:Uncharacterized protein n=1 Tax=Alkalimonas mucilaginosa TaxID=3057676 RepID=A0ABU7JCZ3_9GAMM|nr:hypothetical protein [Alkalimonas sp. MEB004]MEE2023563.1 hypothetical protein [Alkalimonas sp. MEB004]